MLHEGAIFTFIILRFEKLSPYAPCVSINQLVDESRETKISVRCIRMPKQKRKTNERKNAKLFNGLFIFIGSEREAVVVITGYAKLSGKLRNERVE